jgi:DNA transformation protein
LLGCHWQQVPEERRTVLLSEAEAASALLPLPKNKRLAIGGEVRDVTPEGCPGEDREEAPMEAALGFDDPADEAPGADEEPH